MLPWDFGSVSSEPKLKFSFIIVIGPQHSGVEEICEALLRSGKIEGLEHANIPKRDVNFIHQLLRAPNLERDPANNGPLFNFKIGSEYLEEGRLRVPEEALVVMVKSNMYNVMKRWAAMSGDFYTDQSRREKARKTYVEGVKSKMRNAMKRWVAKNEELHPDDARREKAWKTYVEGEKDTELMCAKMTGPRIRVLDVEGNDVNQAVEKVCAEWEAMQRNKFKDGKA